MDRNSKPSMEQIKDEAAAWVVRLSANPSEQERAQFEEWRDQSIDREIAFARELATWERLDGLIDHCEQPVPEPLEDKAQAPQSRPHRRWQALAASVAMISALGAVVFSSLTSAPAYATAVGERRLVRLDDGSSVDLNTDSKIVVYYSGGRRVIELVRGEALFHVARERRPFLIHAKNAKLGTQGSEVIVRLAGENATVTVSEGTVQASPWSGDGPAAFIHEDNEAIVGSSGAIVHKVTDEQIEKSLAWRKGHIALDGRTLSEAVAEFNRYNQTKISVKGQQASNLQVGGYFRATDVDGFISALTTAFPISSTTQTNGDIVLFART